MLPSNFYTDLAFEIRQLNEAVKSSLQRASDKNVMPDRKRLSFRISAIYKKVQLIVREFGFGNIFTMIHRSQFLQPDEFCKRLCISAYNLQKLHKYARCDNALMSREEYDEAIKEEADLFVRLALKDLSVSFIQIKMVPNLIK